MIKFKYFYKLKILLFRLKLKKITAKLHLHIHSNGTAFYCIPGSWCFVFHSILCCPFFYFVLRKDMMFEAKMTLDLDKF